MIRKWQSYQVNMRNDLTGSDSFERPIPRNLDIKASDNQPGDIAD
jgi:hypothetical protein